MAVQYLKKSDPPRQAMDKETGETVARMIEEIRTGGEDAARRYARDLDGWKGEIVVGEATFAAAA